MIDTHLHLFSPSKLEYPWLDGVPALNREFSIADYQAAAGDRIEASVFVECAAAEESAAREAKWVLELADHPENKIAGVVASVWPELEDFSEKLDAIAGHPKLKGLRRVLHTENDGLSKSSLFHTNVASLVQYGLSFDICMSERQLPVAIELMDACPETRLILDHCGVPDIAAGQPEFWQKEITEIAERQNVFCKISGVLVYASEDQRTAEGILPWVDYAYQAFGPDRVMWGGDWPVCTVAAPLQNWISVTEELIELMGLSASEKTAFLSENAKHIYNL